MRALRVLSVLCLSSLFVACVAGEGDDGVEAESDIVTEGSAEARAVLALVNDGTVKAAELKSEARVTQPVADGIVAHRDGPDATFGTEDDDKFDTIRELRGIRGCGPATIEKLFEYAKRKGLYQSGDVSVVFSPQTAENSHLTKIVGEIERAQSSIDIAMYSYSDAKIGEALKAATQRGVKVRFIFNDAGSEQRLATREGSKSYKLEASGVDVRFVNKTMHHKFMIVDGPRDDMSKARTARLVTGSANWSSSAATRYDENTVFLGNNEELLLRFQREFDLMWKHSRDFTGKPFEHVLSTSDIRDESIPDANGAMVWFTSANFKVNNTTFSTNGSNTVSDALVAAINGATSSIHVASGHLRSRPVSEALIAKKQQNPNLDIRVYLDGQEFISKTTHENQLDDLDACLDRATTDAQRRNCTDKGFLFGYQVGQANIEVRYKYYAYRWDHGYAPQMHHKYMVIDGKRLFTGSYNLSDNAEHATFENMMLFEGDAYSALVSSFEQNFESMWKTGRDENKLASVTQRVESSSSIPLVFDPMALTWSEVSTLKSKIRTNCPAADSEDFRRNPGAHMTCQR